MEAQRKEEAAQAVAAVEAAETEAVLQALSQILNSGGAGGNNTPPGVVGEAVMETDSGPVKVAALSVEALAEAGVPAKISAGEDSSAEVEVDAGVDCGGWHLVRSKTCGPSGLGHKDQVNSILLN